VDHAWATDRTLADELGSLEVVRVPRLLAGMAPPTQGGQPGVDGAAPAGPSRHVPRSRARSRVAHKLLLPDRDILWAIPAARSAGRMAGRFDAVLTTAPPFSTHLAGWWLARRHGLPWVAEYRDNWSMNPLYRRGFPAQPVNRWLEGRCIARADAVVTVSDAASDELLAAFPAVTGKVHVAPNGFDPDDLPPPAGRSDTFEIAYAGTLDERRHPAALLAAIRRLSADRPGFAAAVRLRLMGNVLPSIADAAILTVGADRVRIDGLVPHREALVRASRAAVLVAITPEAESGGAGLTSKLFEYLGLRRPILVLAPPSPAVTLVNELAAGRTARPDSADEVVRALSLLHDDWLAGAERTASPDRLASFTRMATAARVAAVLDAVLALRDARSAR
jgi:glycosyltransferase involved in cell wall biosynthesis